jgi:hypothetical protein
VALMTNLSTSDISNVNITSLITESTTQVNGDLNVQVIREPIYYIDNTRSNDINGVNKTYYIKNWKGKFLADRNNDGEITIADVIVYQVDSDGNETTPTISSVDDDDCSVTLSSAPSNVRLFITYAYSPVRQLTSYVDSRVKSACVFLTASYIYAKINFGRSPSMAFGSTRVNRHMEASQLYLEKYRDIINQINSLEEVHSKLSDSTF